MNTGLEDQIVSSLTDPEWMRNMAEWVCVGLMAFGPRKRVGAVDRNRKIAEKTLMVGYRNACREHYKIYSC